MKLDLVHVKYQLKWIPITHTSQECRSELRRLKAKSHDGYHSLLLNKVEKSPDPV